MKVYHVTRIESGKAIVAEGFRDRTGRYLTRNEYTGVWIASRPLVLELAFDVDDMTCFEIEIADELLSGFEWLEEGKRYREWLVPAEVLNAKATYRALTFEETFALV